MKWFKHDSDASMDAKLKRLQIRYGMEGYGLYWYCLEIIASNVNQHNVTFELSHDAEIISHDTNLHQDQVQEMMAYMVDLGLFENTGGIITCMKLAKRLDQSMVSSPEMRKVIAKVKESHDLVMIKSEQNRIEENRKEKKGRFTPPSLSEVEDYCQERENGIDAEAFLNHYEANGWMRGKTKIKDWKACVRTWEKRTPKEDIQYD